MPSTPATSDTTARTVDEQFLDLICNDQDLLAAEFEAIIAAAWPAPPAARPVGGALGEHAGRGAARQAADPVRDLATRPRHSGVGGWARQRSPPARCSNDRQ
jgi:hypothetical protein